MPLVVEDPSKRMKGTASRGKRVPRYKQPESEWKAFDDNTNEEASVPGGERTLPPFQPAERRRKRRKLANVHASMENDFSFFDASENSGTRIAKGTPLPPAAETSTSLVSPPEDENSMTAPKTPTRTRTSEPNHGNRVLDVEYSPDWKNFRSNPEEKDKAQIDSSVDTTENEEIDRLTSSRAAESPRPYDAKAFANADDEIPCENVPETSASESAASPPEARSLAQIANDGRVVTRKRFFSISSYLPVQVLDLGEPVNMRPFQGKVGSSCIHWSQAGGGTGKHLLLKLEPPSDGSNHWTSEGRRQLQWEASILDWVWNRSDGSSPSQMQSFPKPLWLQKSGNSTKYTLCLNLTNDKEVEFQILGTLEDLVHMHVKYNNGPLPEMLIAWLVSQVLDCLSSLHRCGVTHDNLGLDSFLLVRRRQTSAKEEEACGSEWFLVCTGLGSKAKVCLQPTEDPTSKNSQDYSSWRFMHDLYSVVNIAHLLLSGGVSLACVRNDATGTIELQSRQFISNIYLRGKLAWEALSETLLNPPNGLCSLDASGQQGKWAIEMTHATSMLNTMWKDNDGTGRRFLDALTMHVLQDQANTFLIPDRNRFSTKLETSHCINDSLQMHQGTIRERELLAALKEKENMLESLRVETTDELRQANEEVERQCLAANSYQQLADESRSMMEEAIQQKENLKREYHALVRVTKSQSKGMKEMVAEKDRALANLRRDLERRNEESIRLEKENAELIDRLRALEAQSQHDEQLDQLHDAHECIVGLEAKTRRDRAKLNSAKIAMLILEQNELNAQRRVDEGSRSNAAALAELQAKHDATLRQMQQDHEMESESIFGQLKKLQKELSSEKDPRVHTESQMDVLDNKEAKRLNELEEAKSKYQRELKKEICRLGMLVRRKNESESQLESAIEAQKNSYESKLSEAATTSQQREETLRRRIRELESGAAMHGAKPGEPRPHNSTNHAQRDPSTRNVGGRKSTSSTLLGLSRTVSLATAKVIPGMTLTGFLPQTAARARRVVFGNPNESDSE